MSSALLHIAERVLNRPLLVHPDKLALIASILEGRIGIDATELREIASASPEASRFSGSAISGDGRAKAYRVDKGVAIIPVLGSLVNRGAWLGARSGMTSYEGLAFQLQQAAADPDVKSILLDIDSPGGEAVGAFEMADRIRAIGKSKPVVAVVNGMAASAAYAIASAASHIVASPSGVAGSVGVVLMHADYSNSLHQKGIKPTLIHAGAHKVDGNPYEPLSAAVRSDLQAEVDSFYSMFVASVAQGRKGRMTEKAVRATEARTYIGQAALDAGLVDAIGSFETVLGDLSAKAPRSGSSVPTNKGGLSFGLSGQPRLVAADHAVIAAIMALPEAVGREDSARRIAEGGAGLDTARVVLRTLPTAAERQAKQQRVAAEAAVAKQLAANAAEEQRQQAIAKSWDDVHADLARRLGCRK